MSRTRVFTLVALLLVAFTLSGPRAAAQTCRWDGTSPLCSGECGLNETEITRADTSPGSPPAYNGPTFGSACVTGSKAYCCTTPGRTCRWDGTAPFCDGGCKTGETASQPPAGSSSGSSCWTGSKAYCCHTVSGNSSRTGLPLIASTNNNIYAVMNNNELNWYHHDGRDDGTFRWQGPNKVGTGWGELEHLISAGDGIIYGITPVVPMRLATGIGPGMGGHAASGGELSWYHHVGWEDGSFRWEGPKKVGTGWGDFKQVFSGGNGIIYVVTAVVPAHAATGIGPGMGAQAASGGELHWYRHVGREDGTSRWDGPKKVGTGWGDFRQVFSGGNGVIYAVTANGDLMWYRHAGIADGTFFWEGPKKVGTGWGAFKHLFSAGDGIIYAVTSSNDLLWYRHDGRTDGSFRWAFAEGKKVGVGWDVKQVFSGIDLAN